MTTLGKGSPEWDEVVWREVMDVDAKTMLEDKPKESITKRDMTRILDRKMNLKFTLYTDNKPKMPDNRISNPKLSGRRSSESDFPEVHDGDLGPS